MTRVLVVEDRLAFRNHLLQALRAAGVVEAGSASHGELLERAPASVSVDVVLLDAFDLSAQQEDPARSRLTALDVCEWLASTGRPPLVYVYSTAMARPEVNIPLREQTVVRGAFTHTGVLDALDRVVAGTAGGDVPFPGPDAYRALGVAPGAEVAAAHQLMRTRPDAWELVWRRHHPAPAPKTRAWINANIRPLLGLSYGNHRRVVGVIGRVAGLPRD